MFLHCQQRVRTPQDVDGLRDLRLREVRYELGLSGKELIGHLLKADAAFFGDGDQVAFAVARIFDEIDESLLIQPVDDGLAVLARNRARARHLRHRLVSVEDQAAHDPPFPTRLGEAGDGLGGGLEPEIKLNHRHGELQQRFRRYASLFFHLTTHLSYMTYYLSLWESRMHTSTADPRREQDCPFGNPKGLSGALALLAMAFKNGGQNRAAIDALDLRPGESVLEIGCGPGTGLRLALRRVGRGGFVAGVDRSPTAAHFAAHAVHRAFFRGQAVAMRADSADLPFRAALFDKAFAVNTFQFWPDPARALREIERVLAPGGRLVITQRAANPDRPTDFAGAAGGIDRMGQASILLKQLGWRIIDQRCVKDGARLMAASVVAERPA